MTLTGNYNQNVVFLTVNYEVSNKMNSQNSFRTLLILFVLMIFCPSVWSQVAVERSKEKVIISGVPYYLHQVKKGETSYSISKAYGITTEILAKENPDIMNGLKEGQSLRIPVKLVTPPAPVQTTVTQQVVHDEKNFIYHTLQPGETIYSLSRKYGVTESEVINSNPGIDIYKLSTGAELAIPRKEPVISVKPAIQEVKPYLHKVIKGETMYSIARHYGITVRELRRANRDLRFPQVGDNLRIPGMTAAVEKPAENFVADTLPAEGIEEELYVGRPAELTPVTNLSGALNVAVLLPFYLNENSVRNETDSLKYQKSNKFYSETSRPTGWIFPGSMDFLEMYEGILLAADTLRSVGLDINLHVYDIKEDTVGITNLIRSQALDRMDLIIGPVHSRNLSIVAAHVRNLGIPVVSPVQLFDNSVQYNNPSLFLAGSSLAVAQNSIAKKIGDYSGDNIILIHTDTSNASNEVREFKNKILYELSSRNLSGDIKFQEMIFQSRLNAGSDPVKKLSNLLSDKIPNVIIIASEDAPVMSEAIQEVYNLSRKYEITVFGYPEMRLLKNIDPKFFFDLGLMIYSPFWIDYSHSDVKQFCSDFLKDFHTQPSEMSYAWTGYDIAYYFVSGLAIHGKAFIEHPEIHNPDLLYTGFDFRRSSVNDGFENQKLFLIRYTKNYDFELVDDQVIYSGK